MNKNSQNSLKKLDNNEQKEIKAIERLLILIIRCLTNIKTYFYWKNFDKKHLTFGIVDGKFQITSTSHEDFIADTQSKIDTLDQTDTEKFINLSLLEALNGCNFIIFSLANDKNTFIQFWTENRKLKFDFYANKTNGLKKYYYSILGLLSEFGFASNENEQYKGRLIYKVGKNKDFISITANFRKDINLATRFTDMIFEKIYKIKNKKIAVEVQ